MSEIDEQSTTVQELQEQVQDRPYSIVCRLALADKYTSLHYPDLAAGEAYLALLLCDEVTDESGEYHDEATVDASLDGDSSHSSGADPDEWLRNGVELAVYTKLVTALNDCGCLQNALLFCTRGLSRYPEDIGLQHLRADIEHKVLLKTGDADFATVVLDDIPDGTKVRREIYPWNTHEPDRCSDESIAFLNQQLAEIAPKLEARAVNLPDLSSSAPSAQRSRQLGLYAKVDIEPGELLLVEKSILTGTNRLLSEVCDACSLMRNSESTTTAYCEDCTDTTVFCSTECYDFANETYHPAICDTDALTVGKDPAPVDAANAMYTQLLLRVFALSITQDIHPLDLPQIKYLCGTFSPSPSPSTGAPDAESILPVNSLPFTFHHNIQLPLHFLEKMDVNIFTATASTRASTSTINTLYAKLRGVASAKLGTSRGHAPALPEVAAVHPLWCLANHSCAPNVRWEWEGSMRFWAREHTVQWRGADGAAAADDDGNAGSVDGVVRSGGIKAGQEILSHYCDIELPVKERREWAAGALGGECRCERCLWEAEDLLEIQGDGEG